MKNRKRLAILLLGIAVCAGPLPAQDAPPSGFVSLFNGNDLSGWRVPPGDNGHWRVVGGVIDYDAGSEAAGDKSLWTEREYGDFILRVDWRIKETPYTNPNVHIVKPDGTSKLDAAGKPSFNLLQGLGTGPAVIVMYAFDVLMCQGKDVRSWPLAERRQ